VFIATGKVERTGRFLLWRDADCLLWACGSGVPVVVGLFPWWMGSTELVQVVGLSPALLSLWRLGRSPLLHKAGRGQEGRKLAPCIPGESLLIPALSLVELVPLVALASPWLLTGFCCPVGNG
jgi:hypothetical protein